MAETDILPRLHRAIGTTFNDDDTAPMTAGRLRNTERAAAMTAAIEEIERLRARLEVAEAACASYWEWEYGTTHDGGPDASLLVKWKEVADGK